MANDETAHKPSNEIMLGGMALRTRSERPWIRKASMDRHEGCREDIEVAQRWKGADTDGTEVGLSKSEIVVVLAERFGIMRSAATTRGWVNGDRVIARQSEDDMRGIYETFHVPTSDEYVPRPPLRYVPDIATSVAGERVEVLLGSSRSESRRIHGL